MIMKEALTYPTISAEDVSNTVAEIDNENSCFGQLTDLQKTAMYDFASELTGLSIDSLMISNNPDEDETIDDLPTLSQDDVIETIDALQHTDEYEYTEEQMDAIYMFASELIGISVDSIFELMGQM